MRTICSPASAYKSIVSNSLPRLSQLVVNKYTIALHYIKTWFLVDLLACIPIMAFVSVDARKESLKHFRHMVVLCIATKLLKAFKYEVIWQEQLHRQFLTSRLLRFFRVLLYIFVLLHWGSCFWNLMGTDEAHVKTWIR